MAGSAPVRPATVITERRRDGDVIAGFLVVVLGFAALRGWSGAPVVAGLMALGAVVVAILWAYWRRNPAFYLSISHNEISFRRTGKAGITIPHVAGSQLEVHRDSNDRGWVLRVVNVPGLPEISMIGFDPHQVRQTCMEHGWAVS